MGRFGLAFDPGPAAMGTPLLLLTLVLAAAAETGEAVRRSLDLTQIETGELVAVRSQEVRAPGAAGSGELKLVWLVAEGTRVAAGDTLARFDAAAAEANWVAARAQLERTRAELVALEAKQGADRGALRNRLRSAEFAAEQAELRLSRMEYGAQVERESARLDLAKAGIALTESRAKLGSQAVLDSLERSKLMSRIALNQEQAAAARAQAANMALIAPIAGMAVHGRAPNGGAKIQSGENVITGQTVIHLPDLSELEVSARVHELDGATLRPGQTARVGFAAHPELELRGRVAQVSELAQTRRRNSRVRTFEVRIALDGTDPRLRPGMTARVEILVESIADALVVPRRFVGSLDGETCVWPVGAREPRRVEIGARTPLFVQIRSGLEEGTRLQERKP